jgi:hypothetical protein
MLGFLVDNMRLLRVEFCELVTTAMFSFAVSPDGNLCLYLIIKSIAATMLTSLLEGVRCVLLIASEIATANTSTTMFALLSDRDLTDVVVIEGISATMLHVVVDSDLWLLRTISTSWSVKATARRRSDDFYGWQCISSPPSPLCSRIRLDSV